MKLSWRCAPEDIFGPSARALEETQRLSQTSEEVTEMRQSTEKYKIGMVELTYLLLGLLLVLLIGIVAKGQSTTQPTRTVNAQIQQPLFREYRGVRLGMTATETRSKLDEPALKSDEQDFYVISANETVQIAYNAQKVATISIDYIGGVGAPDYRSVVGEGLLERPDGSLFRMVRYNSERFWVSYNKSASVVPVVTITIGNMK